MTKNNKPSLKADFLILRHIGGVKKITCRQLFGFVSVGAGFNCVKELHKYIATTF